MTSPVASIILPTFNRARFLPQAFASIRAQTLADWELIIVDDGSTDGTRDCIAELAAGLRQPIRYVFQENQGPGAARRRGIADAQSDLLAFFDSDDLWLPHHLQDCVAALSANPDVDWVCTDMARVEAGSGRIVKPSKFHSKSGDLKFLGLRAERRGELFVIDDSALVSCLIEHGGFGALQTSLIRRRLFERVPLRDFRIGEDRVLTIEAAREGFRMAYLDAVHVHFQIHGDHTAAVGQTASVQKQIHVFEELLRAYAHLLQGPLSRSDERLLRKKMARECFWQLGYGGLWRSGARREALRYFRQGLQYWPWSARQWKNYLVFSLRAALGL